MRWVEVSEAYRILQDPGFRSRWRARQKWRAPPTKKVEVQERREDDSEIRKALFTALGRMTSEQEYAVKEFVSQFEDPDPPSLDDGSRSSVS